MNLFTVALLVLPSLVLTTGQVEASSSSSISVIGEKNAANEKFVHLSKRLSAKLCQNPLHAFPIPFLDGNQLITGLELESLSLDFSSDPTNNGINVGTASSKDVIVKMVTLPGPLVDFDMSFIEVKQHLGIITPGLHRPVVSMDMPFSPCKGTLKTGLKVDIPAVSLKVENKNAFSDFIRQVTFLDGSINVTMEGNAELKAKYEGGLHIGPWTHHIDMDWCLSDIRFKKPIVMEGMQGLRQGKVLDIPQVVQGEQETGILLEIPFELTNPSNVELKTNNVRADLHYDGAKIGTVLMEELHLKPKQTNQLIVKSLLKPESEEAIQKANDLFSDFAQGKPSKVNIFGHENSTQVDVLIPALSNWNMETEIPGLGKTLVELAHFKSPNLQTMISSSKVKANNPFKTPVTIKNIKGIMKRQQNNVKIGSLNQSFDSFVIPSESTVDSPLMDLKVDFKWGMVWELMTQWKLTVDLETEIEMLSSFFSPFLKLNF